MSDVRGRKCISQVLNVTAIRLFPFSLTYLSPPSQLTHCLKNSTFSTIHTDFKNMSTELQKYFLPCTYYVMDWYTEE